VLRRQYGKAAERAGKSEDLPEQRGINVEDCGFPAIAEEKKGHPGSILIDPGFFLMSVGKDLNERGYKGEKVDFLFYYWTNDYNFFGHSSGGQKHQSI
jgi:hypothetical protein